ncbi:MAG: flagellin FliC [Bdellovibrionales bacterium]|nr:flagellin FliC [Bdellovibrionales bacterium]
MGLRIATNVASINAQRNIDTSQREINKSFAELASGERITKAADDAAGLAISENLKTRLRGQEQAKRNALNGMSLVQVAEGGLNEISNILTRFRELGVQAASDTVGANERVFIDREVQQLKAESQRIAETTRWGDVQLLNGTGEQYDFQVGIFNDDFQDRISFDSGELDANNATLGVEGLDFTSKEGAQSALEVIEGAQLQVNGYRANLGAIQNRLISTQSNLAIAHENLSAANSRIRDADIAESTARLTKNNILLNATTGILSQANQAPSLALKLIG